jgi:thiol-disulfide isomerase/thioredoxin
VAAFHTTSIGERVQKNLNLLSLEGKPAPALDESDFFGPKPTDLAALHGHPVLLFFWAHWCSDCKAEGPVLAELRKSFGPKGLVVIAPTRYYGYTEDGKDAPPATERKYIEAIRRVYYAPLSDVPAPLSNANFLRYGCSTTPTIVLIDSAGIVRLYHPGVLSGQELATRIQALLPK